MTAPTTRADALRRAFDEGFAAPPTEAQATEDFLAVRLGGDPHAIRVTDLARVTAAPKIVPLPSRSAAIVGLASVRGALVVVHSLARVLGYADVEAPSWIALAGGADALGLGIDSLEGFLRRPRGAERVLEAGGVTYAIVDVRAVVETILTGRSNA